MILGQISTFVVFLSLLCLACPNLWTSMIFSKILFCYLCCVYVVLFSFECNQAEKWKWLIVKCLLLISNLIVFRKTIRFRVRDYIASLGILLIYLSFIDINKIYGCNVSKYQLSYVFVASTLTYLLLRCICVP